MVDLIVMSTHGRSGVGRLVFGSVAESVPRGTTVPLLLVRPKGAPVERGWLTRMTSRQRRRGPDRRLEPHGVRGAGRRS
jgi:hypothetical protein